MKYIVLVTLSMLAISGCNNEPARQDDSMKKQQAKEARYKARLKAECEALSSEKARKMNPECEQVK